jgi:succinyl-diaminopimelate desuccinylase
MEELLKRLIQAESTCRAGELDTARIIAEFLSGMGVENSVDIWEQNRANVTARIGSGGSRRPILFASHLDVVGPGEGRWSYPAFGGEERCGRVYGRGAADMKGGITALLGAIKSVLEDGLELQGDIIFVATAGEETDSCGMLRFADGWEGESPAGIIITEPTNFEVVTAHRGMLWVEVTTLGRTAHGSMPQLGVNAITSMRRFLNRLERYEFGGDRHPRLGGCSMSVNTISGGKAVNVVPDRCRARVDMRTLPGLSHEGILEDFREMFVELGRDNADFQADLEILRSVDALETDTESEFVREVLRVVGASETCAVGFTTDGPHLAGLGAPIVVFGPGDGNLCHKPDEYIEIADLERGAEYYRRIIEAFLC